MCPPLLLINILLSEADFSNFLPRFINTQDQSFHLRSLTIENIVIPCFIISQNNSMTMFVEHAFWHPPGSILGLWTSKRYFSGWMDFRVLYFQSLSSPLHQFSHSLLLHEKKITYDVISRNHSNWPSLNLSQNVREGETYILNFLKNYLTLFSVSSNIRTPRSRFHNGQYVELVRCE